MSTARLLDELAGVVGAGHVIRDDAEREFFSTDLSMEVGEIADLVVAPASAEEVAGVVRVAADLGIPLAPRGGGMSYTHTFVPGKPGAVLLDMRRMKQIDVNIDEDDGVIQFDGASVPPLTFQTPAGLGTLLFVPRLAEGSIDRDTGEIVIENVFIGLEFLGNVLPVSFRLSTGFESAGGFGATGVPLDDASGEVILVGVALTPAGPQSPSIAIAFIIEGILRGE